MKKIIFIALLSFVVFSNTLFANDQCMVIGYHDPKTHEYDGPTFCEQATINGIVVRGPLETNQSILSAITDVSGPIKSTKTQFDNLLMENNYTTEKVALSNNSIVKNNIVFEGSHRGIVILDGTSMIKGHVINGDIERH